MSECVVWKGLQMYIDTLGIIYSAVVSKLSTERFVSYVNSAVNNVFYVSLVCKQRVKLIQSLTKCNYYIVASWIIYAGECLKIYFVCCFNFPTTNLGPDEIIDVFDPTEVIV